MYTNVINKTQSALENKTATDINLLGTLYLRVTHDVVIPVTLALPTATLAALHCQP
jgi:hypothetical protein